MNRLSRRHFLHCAAGALLTAPVIAPVFAHHGWSSFNQDQPLYLSGTVGQVRWQNPHAEVVLQVDDAKLPEGLATRSLPPQSQSVDAAGILKKAQVPANAKGSWDIEFAPLSRMQAWGLTQPLKAGDRIEVIGYALADGKRVLRVEYLFVNGKAHGLRSSPA